MVEHTKGPWTKIERLLERLERHHTEAMIAAEKKQGFAATTPRWDQLHRKQDRHETAFEMTLDDIRAAIAKARGDHLNEGEGL